MVSIALKAGPGAFQQEIDMAAAPKAPAAQTTSTSLADLLKTATSSYKITKPVSQAPAAPKEKAIWQLEKVAEVFLRNDRDGIKKFSKQYKLDETGFHYSIMVATIRLPLSASGETWNTLSPEVLAQFPGRNDAEKAGNVLKEVINQINSCVYDIQFNDAGRELSRRKKLAADAKAKAALDRKKSISF